MGDRRGVSRRADPGTLGKLRAAAISLTSKSGEASDEELSALGLTREDVAAPDEHFEGVWPDNWESVAFFLDLMTQWRFSVNGPTGIDYTAAVSLLDIRGVRVKRRRNELFDDMRVMETALLSKLREIKK